MNKPAKNNRQDKLKDCPKQSHNVDSSSIALVKSLARIAAEEYFKALMKSNNLSDIEGEE